MSSPAEGSTERDGPPEGAEAAGPSAELISAGLGTLLFGAAAGWALGTGRPLAAAAALALALGALTLVHRRWRRAGRARQLARDAQETRLHRLERRAKQLDEAEQLVSVGSFDWFPPSGELHWSEQHYRQWGYEPGAVQPSLEVFLSGVHPDDLPHVQDHLQRALRDGRRYDCRHRVRRPDGSVLHVHARGEVFFDARQQPLRMIGAVLDITERVQAEAALRVHGFVLDALPDAISVLDGETGRYRLANQSWLDANRVAREQALGRRVDEVFPVVVNEQRRRALADCLQHDRAASVRGPSPSPGQPGRLIETRYFPFHDPELGWRGAVMVSRDITEDESVRAELARSVDNLRLTLNIVGDAIFATAAESPDDPVLFTNEQLLQVWHIPPERAQPLTARTIIEYARRFFVDPDAEVARIGAIIGGSGDAEHRLQLNDGRTLLRRCRRAEAGGHQVRVWTFRDITAESQALRSLAAAEAQQRTLLAAFPGYIWVVDGAHRVVYLNPAAASVYEPTVPRPPEPARHLFGGAVYERLQPSIERALAGETLAVEWYRPSRSGRTPEHMLIRMTPGAGPEGQQLCYAFGVDISSLKQAEAALVAAKEEAERANLAKTQFLSAMSHELRTPLNAVIGFSQVLELNTERNLSARQLRHVGDIRRAGQHLLTLINDLLDLARIEAGRTQLTLVPVPLAALAAECVQLVQPMLDRSIHVLQLPSPPQAAVQADRTRLKQVLINLLSNAIKYNRDGGHVDLSWQAGPDGRWRIAVHDDGPGISPALQDRLFRPFERLAAEGSDVIGTGIGLALSRSLVQLMQGTIGVRSQPGEGSTFWIDLQGAPDLAAPVATLPTARRGPRRLLYVDDNPVNLALMEGLFEELPGWQLITSDRPLEVLPRLHAQPVDLLLVDLQMPDLDGYELFRRVRGDPTTQALPMIAVSADVSPETAQRCLRMGFAQFVPKPVDAQRLLDAAERALQPAGPAS
ncbi:MAG: PAS domain-containing protein [Rubrivivax sp.]